MFTVYKITNLINNKVYIGSSIDVARRWREHKTVANNPNHKHYNYPLYQAFRKYGLDNFYFEIIKDDFNSVLEMQLFENAQIIAYDAVNNGYNQTYQTIPQYLGKENLSKTSNKQACAKVDSKENIIEIYPSYHEAARQNYNSETNGDQEATKIRLVCKGKLSSYHGDIFRDLDENKQIISKPIKNYKNKTHLIAVNVENPMDILYFDSIKEAAEVLHSDRGSISKSVRGDNRYNIIKGYIFCALDINGNIVENNITIEDRIKEYNRTNPLINGERHTIKDWCKIYNISTTSYYRRIKKGMSVIEALTTPKRG